MTAYVDQASIVYKGKPRHHLTADSLAELHAFAAAVGIRPCWFHRGARHPHYDITDPQRDAALAAGAQAVDNRTLMTLAKRLRPAVGSARTTRPAGETPSLEATGIPTTATSG